MLTQGCLWSDGRRGANFVGSVRGRGIGWLFFVLADDECPWSFGGGHVVFNERYISWFGDGDFCQQLLVDFLLPTYCCVLDRLQFKKMIYFFVGNYFGTVAGFPIVWPCPFRSFGACFCCAVVVCGDFALRLGWLRKGWLTFASSSYSVSSLIVGIGVLFQVFC